MNKIVLGGLPIVHTTRGAFARQMIADCLNRVGGPAKVSFSCNGYVVAKANIDQAYARLLAEADYIDADGMPLVFASKVKYATPLPERIATTDFFHDAAEQAASHGVSFFLLGGTPDVNEAVATAIRARHPALCLAGRHHGYFKPADEAGIFAQITASGADVVWVGMGTPRQEALALRIRDSLIGPGWIKTCGGLFDHIIEAHPRAPDWMQSRGLEWLYRMYREPRRLGWRYIWSSPLAAYFLHARSAPDKGIV
ncbi:WecB/TagA/CpsF family glycosyltransferase [Sphingomonas dokdonensis]|uniref:UDP-N-acetyl-D-mannosaminuronic acid transferase n=1 Tax=Sphingomonas dokdonensis TaxID=344880 RepID=A0A245ZKZ1_9SPHN|nr:WecB/TagA/CpsF family glycosyltransferase [Sphingomonas dokdonensis]OWK30407.1 UDP-N-acetyl-D-mannosaminuronic acid transferase [Sphingomonas dokdonensis]